MKKLVCLIAICTFLCGCGESTVSSQQVEEPITEQTTEAETLQTTTDNTADKPESVQTTRYNIDDLAEKATLTHYDGIEDFMSSPKYEQIKDGGYTLYLPDYDEGVFTVVGVSTDIEETASWYTVYLREIDTQKLLVYTIRYRSDVTRPEDFGEELDLSGSMSTTAESGGATYDVYLASSALNEVTNYHLFFMPAEGYLASLAIKSGTVYPEEIIDYFSRLSLKTV